MKKEEGKIRLILLWFGKNWKAWVPIAVPIIVSIVALVISCKSNRIASDANRIANDAYETSNYQFLQVNRPYIILSIKIFDNEQFLQVTQEGKIVRVGLKYEIKNIGNVAAKDIAFPDKNKFTFGKLPLKDLPVKYNKSGKFTLGPGGSFDIKPHMAMRYESEETAKECYEILISDKSSVADILLSVDYTNELDKTQRYRTFVQDRIDKNVAHVIKSEMLNLSDKILTK